MRYTYTVRQTPESYVQATMQAVSSAFPAWVRIVAYSGIFVSYAVVTFILTYAAPIILPRIGYTPRSTALVIYVAFCISVVLNQNLIWPRLTTFMSRYSRFDRTTEYDCRYEIDETGVLCDQGDVQTRIAWSAIGGVYTSGALFILYSRGLIYFVPKSSIGDGVEVATLLEACRAWQAAAAPKTEAGKTFV